MRTVAFVLLTFVLLPGVLDRSHADELQPLIEDLHSTDVETRLRAIKSLGESGDVRAVPALLAAAYREHGVVRQYAIEALQHLTHLLDDVHMVVKRWLQSIIETLRSGPNEERASFPSLPLPLDLSTERA
jgi:HEAT repeat protein